MISIATPGIDICKTWQYDDTYKMKTIIKQISNTQTKE